MEVMPHPTERCWCGYDHLVPFSPEYLRCPHCESLVVASFPDPQTLLVYDDEKDFYGRKYYEELLVQKLGFPRLEERAVLDLPERCLHWLRAFLQYKVPPGKVLELGSAHGGFVALLRWMGFDATGLELSPWLVDFARKTFDVPMLEGPVDEQNIAPGSLDAIALMDVLEHLSDPVRTIMHCVSLIRNDGVLVIQTPRYREGKTYEDMLADNDRFVEQLKAEQHLYLFSRTSIQKLLREVGAGEVAFEKAIFGTYDMFLFASRSPLRKRAEQEVRCRLNGNPSSRLIGALIDLDDRVRQVDQNWRSAEADRAARLAVIEEQGSKLGEAEHSHNLLAAELAATSASLEVAEADRAARLEVIEEQGSKLGEAEHSHNLLAAELARCNPSGRMFWDPHTPMGDGVRCGLQECTALGLRAPAHHRSVQGKVWMPGARDRHPRGRRKSDAAGAGVQHQGQNSEGGIKFLRTRWRAWDIPPSLLSLRFARLHRATCSVAPGSA